MGSVFRESTHSRNLSIIRVRLEALLPRSFSKMAMSPQNTDFRLLIFGINCASSPYTNCHLASGIVMRRTAGKNTCLETGASTTSSHGRRAIPSLSCLAEMPRIIPARARTFRSAPTCAVSMVIAKAPQAIQILVFAGARRSVSLTPVHSQSLRLVLSATNDAARSKGRAVSPGISRSQKDFYLEGAGKGSTAWKCAGRFRTLPTRQSLPVSEPHSARPSLGA